MPNVIVPVGLSEGVHYPIENPPVATVPDHATVSLGDRSATLSLHEARVWGASGFDPAKHARLENTRASLVGWLKEHEPDLTDPDGLVGELLRTGLLLEFDPVDGDLEPVFRRYVLHPLGQGLGNKRDAPHVCQIGSFGEPILEVDHLVYSMWSQSFVNDSLWQSCEEWATEVRDLHPDEEDSDADPRNVARQVAVNLPLIVSSGCGFLIPNWT